MDRKALREKVCSRYCSYYKPGRDRETACLGFDTLLILAEKRDISCEISGSGNDPAQEEVLRVALCVRCPFFREDCDFASRTHGAPPCGGFILLKNLLATGRLGVDDLSRTE